MVVNLHVNGIFVERPDGTSFSVACDFEAAKFICRACNCHDDLLAALKNMLAIYRQIPAAKDDWNQYEIAARAAITKATENAVDLKDLRASIAEDTPASPAENN